MILAAVFQVLTKCTDLVQFVLYALVFMPFCAGVNAGIVIFLGFLYFILPFIQVFFIDFFFFQYAENTQPASDQFFVEFGNVFPRSHFNSYTVISVNKEHAFTAMLTGMKNGAFNDYGFFDYTRSLILKSCDGHFDGIPGIKPF